MYGKLKATKNKQRTNFLQNAFLLFCVLFAFVLADSLYDRGIPQRWGTAILGTILPFGYVIYAYRKNLLRWPFWISVAVCLSIHLAIIWFIFQYVMSSFQRFSILLWLPIMLIETFGLLVAVRRLAAVMTGEQEALRFNI
jgi:hypothetical protein